MSNMVIGNVRLTVDPDSIALIDIKNNIELPSSRNSGANILPTGSSDIAIQVGVVFPDEDDINVKLRGILALKRGMPLINVQSQVLAAMHINAFASETIADDYLNKVKSLNKARLEEQQNAPADIARLLAYNIARTYINQNLVSIVTVDTVEQIIFNEILPDIPGYLELATPKAAADSLTKKLKNLYKPIIEAFAKTKGLDSDSRYQKIDYTKDADEIVIQFFKLYTNKNEYIDTARTGVVQSTEDVIYIGSNPRILDFDTVQGTSPNIIATYRIAGMDAYESFVVPENKTGQNFYDRSAASYNDSIPVKYNEIWHALNNVTILKFGQAADEARTMAEFRLRNDVSGLPSPLSDFAGKTGEIANSLMVKAGYAWPMALQSNVYTSARDKIYVDAAKEAMLANRGYWNHNTGLPDYYNNGYTLGTDLKTISPVQTGALKTVLPSAFRQAAKAKGYVAKIKLSDIYTFPGFTAGQVEEFDLIVTYKESSHTIKIRAIKNTSTTFNEFVNKYYYFMTLHRGIGDTDAFSGITKTKDNIQITDTSNTNPYYLNGFIGPSNLADIGNGNVDYLHLFMAFSEIANNSAANLSTSARYHTALNTPVPITEFTEHVPAQSISAAAKTYAAIKEQLKSAELFVGLNNPDINTNGNYTKILNVFEQNLRRKKQQDIGTAADSKADSVNGDAQALIPISYIDDWIPLAIESISISTIPDRPKALYASIRLLPFDHSPYSPIFAYIASDLKAISPIALPPEQNRWELDLARTPIVERWLESTYLTDNNDKDYVGYYTTNPVGSDLPDLEIVYSYPLTVFANYDSAVNGQTVKVYQDARLRFYTRDKKSNETNVDTIENVYNTTIASINCNEDNNIKRIPLQASLLPVIQHMGNGSAKFKITFQTRDLNSIISIRKIDAFMNIMARRNMQDKLPVKVQLVHPMANMIGPRNYFITNTVISDTPGQQGWYNIDMDFMETSVNKVQEDLVKINQNVKLDSTARKDIATVLANKLVANLDNPSANAMIDNLWSLLVGPSGYLKTEHIDNQLHPLPFTLAYVDASSQSTYSFKLVSTNASKITTYTFNGNSIESINLIGRDDAVRSLKSDTINIMNYTVKYGGENTAFNFDNLIAPLLQYDKNNDISTMKRFMSLLHISPLITVKDTALFNKRVTFFSNDISKRIDARGIPFNPIAYGSITDMALIREEGFVRDGSLSQSLTNLYVSSDNKDLTLNDGSFTLNPLRVINLLTNNESRGVGALGTDQFKNSDLFDTTTGQSYAQQGFWGHYMDSVDPDTAFEQRSKIYRTKGLSISNKHVNVSYQFELSKNNLPATLVSFISDMLHLMKQQMIKDNDTAGMSALRDMLKTAIATNLSLSSYSKFIVSIINNYSDSDTDIASLLPTVQNTQNTYQALRLPIYNEVYGARVHPNTSYKNISTLLLKISTKGMSINNYTLQSHIVSLEKVAGNGNIGVVESKLSSPYTSSGYKDTILAALNQIAELDLSAEKTADEIKRGVELKNNVTELIDILTSNGNTDGTVELVTSVDNFPTYQELGTPAGINSVGIQDMSAAARSGTDTVEPGWQYYTPYPENIEEVLKKPTSLPKSVKNDGPRTSDSISGPDSTLKVGAFADKSDASSKTVNNINTKTDYDTKNKAFADGLSDSKSKLHKIIDWKITEQNTNANQSNTKQITNTANEKNKDNEPQPGDSTKVNQYTKQNEHPLKANYLSTMAQASARFQTNRVFDFRRMYPNVSLFFIRDINNPDAIFENWAEMYRYDSIQYVAVTSAKEEVATAVIRMTNITGVLSNEVNYDKKNIAQHDVDNNGEVTTRKAGSDNHQLTSDGKITNISTNNNDKAGDIIAFNLMPGTKIQIRTGYSSVDNENQIIFTGRVAEVRPGSYIEIIAQGHDYEGMRNVTKTWSGSYNSFPTIISDMLKDTSNFGNVELFPYQANYYEEYNKNLPESAKRGNFAVGYEKESGLNNTTNDNLWGIKDDGSLDSFLRFDRFFNGHNWHCNGPLLENIYSMRRYLSNYAVSVRPFDRRATLFFGPKDSLYIYTADNIQDKVKFNKLYKVLSDRGGNQLDTYSGPSYDVLNTISIYETIQNAENILKSPTAIASAAASVSKRGIDNISLDRNILNKLKSDGITAISSLDVARQVFYIFRNAISGDIFSNPLFLTFLGIHSIEGAVIDGYKFPVQTSGYLELPVNMDKKLSVNTSSLNPNELGKETIVYNKTIVTDIESASTSIRKKAIASVIENFLDNSQRESNIFRNIYSNEILTGKALSPVTIGTALRRKFEHSPISTIDDIKGIKSISSIGYEQFADQVSVGLNGNDVLSKFDINIQKPLKIVSDLWHKIYSLLCENLRNNTRDIRTAYLNVRAGLTDEELNIPLIYYALYAGVIIDGRTTDQFIWAGYASAITILNFDTKDKNRLNDGFIRNLLLFVVPACLASIVDRYDAKPTAPNESAYSSRRNANPIAPDRKPFRMQHNIFDNIIVNNSINASTSNMANKVQLFYPNDSHADESPEKIKDSNLQQYTCSFAPILKEDLMTTAFDANADFASYGADKAVQVAHEFLGDNLREMYQGSITILGEPDIWPYHTLYIKDNLKQMSGIVEVNRVTHIWDASAGYTTTIEPHLSVYVNEDIEANAVFNQNIGSAGLQFAKLTFTIAAVFASLAASPLAIVAVAAMVGSDYLGDKFNRGREQNATMSLFGLDIPWPTAVGYISNYNADPNAISVRRNPCRISPMVYKDTPMVAGLSGYEHQFTNMEVTNLNDEFFTLGRAAYIRDIWNYYSKIVTNVQNTSTLRAQRERQQAQIDNVNKK